MPRKTKSSGIATQQDKTSARRAAGAVSTKHVRNKRPVQDGGKWAGTGRKTVAHSEGPAIARQHKRDAVPKRAPLCAQTSAIIPIGAERFSERVLGLSCYRLRARSRFLLFFSLGRCFPPSA